MKKFKSDDNRVFGSIIKLVQEEKKRRRQAERLNKKSWSHITQLNNQMIIANFTADRIQLADNERPAAAAATTVVAE